MKSTYKPNNLSIIRIFGLMILLGFSSASSQIPNTKEQNKEHPYDYNKRYVYVFAVKKTDQNNKILDIDTLGLMCTNKICSWDSAQKVMAWAYIKTERPGKFVLNETETKRNNMATGIISSSDTFFIHPARDQYKILEICAFPFLQFPLYTGKEWVWDLEIGKGWSPGNIKWKSKSTEVFEHQYKVTGTEIVDVPAGKINCFKIHTETSSVQGKASADFYYSYQYGIVRMDYLPLDKTRIEINLMTSFDDLNLFKSHEMFYKMSDPGEVNWNFNARQIR